MRFDPAPVFPLLPYADMPYVRTHERRYAETLPQVPTDGQRILELGANWPYTFANLLRARQPGVDVVLAENREESLGRLRGRPGSQPRTLPAIDGYCGEQPAQAHYFNCELERWPFADATFDGIVCLELLEHLLVDPFFLCCEASRVLRPGGWFVLTTPNIASLEGVARLLHGASPYLYGPYSGHGPYGRHSREYTPDEVKRLGEAAHFDTISLDTFSPYPSEPRPSWVEQVLHTVGDDPARRGQAICWVGRRREETLPQFPAPPEGLFDYDPSAFNFHAELTTDALRLKTGEASTVEVRYQNVGSQPWPAQESRAVLSLLDAYGSPLSLYHVDQPLDHPVQPGETLALRLSLPAPAQAGDYLVRADLILPGTWLGHTVNPRNTTAWARLRVE
ncbi:MAG: methyltransferase domain-containing protein [Verrucomicrobiota bacterium JB022]|nr:methyltransferase domain-containing protein [Verrucomicrobiota bacterium JB022]